MSLREQLRAYRVYNQPSFCGVKDRGFNPRRWLQQLLWLRGEITVKRSNPFSEKRESDLRSDEKRLSRRKILGMLSATGAGMALSPRSFAQSVGGGPRIIDTHHHIFPPAFTARNLKRMTDDSPTFPGSFYTNWTPRYSLEQMDQNGVATAIGSMTSPGV